MTRDLRPTSVIAAERIKQGAKPMRAPYMDCEGCRDALEERLHYLDQLEGWGDDGEIHVQEYYEKRDANEATSGLLVPGSCPR